MYSFLFEGFMLALISYFMVAMMAILFAQRHDYTIDNNQELAANGLSCIVGAFFNSLASSTSPPRCFLMESTGGRTQVLLPCFDRILFKWLVLLFCYIPLMSSFVVSHVCGWWHYWHQWYWQDRWCQSYFCFQAIIQPTILSMLFMATLHSRCGHYILQLWLLSFFLSYFQQS